MFGRGTVLVGTLAALLPGPAAAQAVVSVRAGVINFFEGSVLVDGQQIEPKNGKFYEVNEGSSLWTDNGRAEVMLTPGVFVRVAEESAIRMVSTRLSDARVDFKGGEIALEVTKGATSSTGGVMPDRILYHSYEISFSKPGKYRFTSEPSQLLVHTGEARVVSNGKSVVVKEGQALTFSTALIARNVEYDAEDSLDRWVAERSQTLAASNAAQSNVDDFSGSIDNGGGAPDPASIFADIPAYNPLPNAGYYSGYGPGYMGAGYWGPFGLYPMILRVPGSSGLGVMRSPIWNVYRGPVTTGTPGAWHPSPRPSVGYRAPSGAAHPVGHAPAMHVGHR